MEKGIVKWFDSQKGFGFILTENKEDLFVHYTNINISGHKTLEQGQEVKFETIQSTRGKQATNVTII